jgi:peptide/nickel transport system permease protein
MAEMGIEKSLNHAQIAWRNFRQNRTAMTGAIIVIAILLVAIFSPVLAPQDPLKMTPKRLQPPSKAHLLGTDQFGRDQLSRLMYGTKASMAVSFGAVGMATLWGILLGLISGYYGGRIDNVIMRCLDVIFAFPLFLLALVIVAVLGPSLKNLILTIGFIYAATFARIVRGSVLSLREKEFVESARSMGARDASIIFHFILPNIFSPLIVQATFNLSTAIMIEAALSFLGLGTQPPDPAWGMMLNESRSFMEISPWMAIFPGTAIMLAVLGFNLLGDGLRDALDPRLIAK